MTSGSSRYQPPIPKISTKRSTSANHVAAIKGGGSFAVFMKSDAFLAELVAQVLPPTKSG
jgi:hypothetical protein